MLKNSLAMTEKFGRAAAMTAASLMVLSGALSACEERPYQPSHSAAPAPRPPADLMGAPDRSPYAAPPVVQPYAPPTAYAPPSTYPSPAYSTPAYPSSSYDTSAVVAMAPIPNPGAPGSEPYYGGDHGRVHHRYEAAPVAPLADTYVKSPYGEGHPAPGRRPAYAYSAPAPVAPKPVYTPPKPATYAKAAPAPVPVPPKAPSTVATTTTTIAHKSAAVAAAAGAAASVAAVDAQHAAKAAVQTAKARTAAPPAPVPAPSADRTANLASLQTTLTDAIGKGAVLTAPASFVANKPVDVSLTVPADFADTLRGDAQKLGLADAAASVNMTALLSGDGFSVTPDDTQSAPLVTGEPTQFHWTVTAMADAKGPLHADVGADLLGGGSDKLALGSVQKASGMGLKLTPRVIGASLLVLIAALVVAWLARGRGGPTRSAEARRASRRAARGGRPLDMGAGTDETTAH